MESRQCRLGRFRNFPCGCGASAIDRNGYPRPDDEQLITADELQERLELLGLVGADEVL
jgi:hypothetical protein